MFNFKIIILIAVWLSVDYLSAVGNDDEPKTLVPPPYITNPYHGFSICLNKLKPTFGRDSELCTCIKRAVSSLKLFGNDSYTYDPHVKMYYEQLYLYVDPVKIQDPREFCTSKDNDFNEDCFKALKIFTQDMGFDQELPRRPHILAGDNQDQFKGSSRRRLNETLTDEERAFLIATMGPSAVPPEKNPSGGSSTQGGSLTQNPSGGSLTQYLPSGSLTQNSPGGSSTQDSSGGSSTQDVKMRIIKNALYYHRHYRPRDGPELRSADHKITHHGQRTFGESYLVDINKRLLLKQVSGRWLDTPWHFCRKLYNISP